MRFLTNISETQIRIPDFNLHSIKNFRELAEWTGLEPATPGVTGRYSNQLNYHSRKYMVGAVGIEPTTLAL